MIRKIGLLLVIFSVLAFVGGCSSVIVKKPLSIVMDRNAAIAAVSRTGEIKDEQVDRGLEWVAKELSDYYQKATINLFAYLFDKEKQLFCTAKFYEALQKQKALAEVVVEKKDVLSLETKKQILRNFYRILVLWKLAKDGKYDRIFE